MEDILNIAIIGFGRMGKKHLRAIQAQKTWRVKYICDIDPDRTEEALQLAPDAKFTLSEDEIFSDPEIQVVALCALAGSRYERIRKAVERGIHIVAEKPIACTLEEEWKAVRLVEGSEIISTVNTYLRNAWYTHELREFARSGEIGELAIVRVCHMTPGLAPGEGHEYEGPSFHDCGMHYVDITRWFAESEYKTGHAQAVRMWDWKDPWWLQCHGTFENGIVFDIIQGHVYGQLSKDQTHNCYMELIGTKGIARMTHDFKTAVVEKRGVSVTERVERPYGDKNLPRMYELMAEAIRAKASGDKAWESMLPTFRDATIASEYAWKMLDDARKNDLPSIGDNATLEEIHRRRATMTNGYGLIGKQAKN